MGRANLYSIELAIDSSLARNGRENEITMWSDGEIIEYGAERFRDREGFFRFLKSHEPRHDDIREYIDRAREKHGNNSPLEGIFQEYERHYGNKQKVISTVFERSNDLKNEVGTLENARNTNDIDFSKNKKYTEKLPQLASYFDTKNLLSKVGKTTEDLKNELYKRGFLLKNTENIQTEDIILAVSRFQESIIHSTKNGDLDSVTMVSLFFLENTSPQTPIKNANIQNVPSSVANLSDIEILAGSLKEYLNIVYANIDFLKKNNKTIANLQTALKNAGYEIRDDSGVYDVGTFYALKSFQANTPGLSPSGKLDAVTFEKLFSKNLSSLKNPTQQIDRNSQGEKIKNFSTKFLSDRGKTVLDLQNILMARGFYDQQPTGIYDQNTFESVKKVQSLSQKQFNNLKFGADGIVGPETYELFFGNGNRIYRADTGNIVILSPKGVQSMQKAIGENTELLKSLGYSVKDLKTALSRLQVYSGNIDNTYDEALFVAGSVFLHGSGKKTGKFDTDMLSQVLNQNNATVSINTATKTPISTEKVESTKMPESVSVMDYNTMLKEYIEDAIRKNPNSNFAFRNLSSLEITQMPNENVRIWISSFDYDKIIKSFDFAFRAGMNLRSAKSEDESFRYIDVTIDEMNQTILPKIESFLGVQGKLPKMHLAK